MPSWLSNLIRLRENVESVDSYGFVFGQSWARARPGLVVALAVAAMAASLWYYSRAGRRGGIAGRVLLAGCRGGLLGLLIVILGDPIFRIAYTHRPKPLLYLVFDGTESMAIADRLPETKRAALDAATGRAPADNNAGSQASASAAGPTRQDYVAALLRRPDENLFNRLAEKFRLKCFQFSRRDEVDALASGPDPESFDWQAVAGALSTAGQVTNLAAALESLRGKHASTRLAGVVMFSDFGRNSGGAAAGAQTTPAERLGVPIYTVGVGPEEARDVQAKVNLASVMRKGDKRAVTVSVEHQGLAGQSATIRVFAQRLGSGEQGASAGEPIEVGSRTVTLAAEGATVETFDFMPPEPGLYDVTGEVVPLAEETATDNNRAVRKLKVLDEFVRLLFVEYEPTWEWRFIKEVFHRDPLVGLKGFRTYLHSAHPKVKQSKELFISSLTPRSRSEFFANDVIFLGDVPAEVLTKAFCERLEEFVGEFGGGLVVMAGPRFGAGQYARVTSNPDLDEALARIHAMLPVEIDPAAGIREGRFRLELTPLAGLTEFMRLGEGENAAAAWDNLGYLPWYQPVRALRGTRGGEVKVLATHPTDLCVEGDKGPQPLIATRPYGKGQVVYLGFNETWRLRRKYGEKYYQQFWGQLIHQLGFSHELGADKRFVVRVDSDELRYFAGDRVTLSAEAYDEEFKPLDADKATRVAYRITRPSRAAAAGELTEELSLPLVHAGRFETRFQVFSEGTYRVQVKDPITSQWRPPVSFTVSSRSAERRSAVRNLAEQEAIARQTGGQSYDLTTVGALVDDVAGLSKTETTVEVHKLWSTWPCFALVVALMLGEWFGRKMVNLS